MISPPVKSFREMGLEQLERTLGEYRNTVSRLAAGGTLTGEQKQTIRRALDAFGLPRYAVTRDVKAAREWWAAGSEYRRQELAVVFPHLFSDPREYAERREADKARRRAVLEEIRRAGL